MAELNVLEQAIESCQEVERSLLKSITIVRRLNTRFNTDLVADRCKKCALEQCIQVHCESQAMKSAGAHRSLSKAKSKHNRAQPCRSSVEVSHSNGRINYRFIQFKRSMETLLVLVAHAIHISNRQKNFVHINVQAHDSKTRLCHH